jgi:maltokinase
MPFQDSLARWLPAQRWYSGTAAITDLAITSQVTLAEGDPELRHLIVTVPGARYQVLTGLRARVPEPLRRAVIGPADQARTAYDALYDPALAAVLLRGMAQQERTGPLRFVSEPGAGIDTGRGSVVLSGEQSNTSLIFGDSAILKVLRRPFPGQHPDLEVNLALARRGSAHVAEPLGWIETSYDGEPMLLAILSRYLPGACDGWSLAAASLAASADSASADSASADSDSADSDSADFAAEAHALGQATAEVHADLAAAFGSADLGPLAFAELAGQMSGRLDAALDQVPELGPYRDKVRSCFAELTELRGPLRVQRLHGDYHLGQVLRAASGNWVILDFEGEPSVPLAQRRAMGAPLRDVAGMLRSFDYAARHRLLGRGEAANPSGQADRWVRSSQAAFCDGYAVASGADPRASGVLLRAFMLDKAVYEVVYEARHRPSWLPIPLGAIARAS